MAKRLFVTLSIKMPDDLFSSADVYKALQPPWASLLEALKTSGAEYDVKFQELEQRASGKRGPRKPRLVPPSEQAA